ncbi:MAG: helix-turn-helix transcriptional regulator [Planctomycetes bacterium]|nr:helix-turn-helix transcriptional regulator [Planctomycetota bacterium]
MKRKMNFGRFEDWLREQRKDARFRRGYEAERRAAFLAYRIVALRSKLGLSQREMARRMGTSQQAIARLESGEYGGFTLKTLEKVAEALGAELVVDIRRPARKPAV